MKRAILFSLLLFALGPASWAKAEKNVGAWRWLGMGWGDGYHSGASKPARHHHHHSHGPMTSPAWEEGGAWPTEVQGEPTPASQPAANPTTFRGMGTNKPHTALKPTTPRLPQIIPLPPVEDSSPNFESARKSRSGN